MNSIEDAHVGLVFLLPAGGFHAGERVEDEQPRLELLAELEEAGLPLGVVELDALVRRDVQPAAQLLRVDPAAAAERVEPAPERGPPDSSLTKTTGPGSGTSSVPNAGRPVAIAMQTSSRP